MLCGITSSKTLPPRLQIIVQNLSFKKIPMFPLLNHKDDTFVKIKVPRLCVISDPAL